MDAESAKKRAGRWITGIWNDGDFELMDEIASPGYTYSVPGEDDLRGDEFREFVSAVRSAFPDLHNSIEEQVAEENLVVTRGVTRGTHRGTFQGLEPTGRSVSVPWVIFTRFRDGRIAGDWELYDAAGLMAQLGSEDESD